MHSHPHQDTPLWDALWINANLATMHTNDGSEGCIKNGAIAVCDSKIVWIGQSDELSRAPETYAKTVHYCHGQWLTPGLIDCHTHLVFAGNRASEFLMRLNGVSYEEIARRGGGIKSTVKATRAAPEQTLINSASARLEKLLAEGVTTVEIKSGYGLTTASEITQLRAAKKLQDLYDVNIYTTFLGAHTIPQDYLHRRSDYLSLICDEMIPAVANKQLASAVDVFCESIAFSIQETQTILSTAKHYGLNTKLHADQLADSGGALLAAKNGALSADHIEYASIESIEHMAANNTVAVLLPGAYYFLREKKAPPIAQLREHNVAMAIATDANPGSSPTTSLLLMMNMACTLFQMTPAEALAGVTINAAKALGADNDIGSLAVGKRADFALWEISELAELSYWLGSNHCSAVVKDGVTVVR